MAISESERRIISRSLRYLQETSDGRGEASADGRVESDSGHFREPAAHSATQITPAQLEVEIRERLALLVALNIKAQGRLTGVAHDDARRDMLRAESDALTCLRTLALGAYDVGGLTHTADDTAPSEGGKCE